MARRLGVAETLKQISDLPTFEERQNALGSCHQNVPLVMSLKYMFDPAIVFDLPEGAPPYKENQFVDQQSNYYVDFRRMYLFIKGGNDNLNSFRRETLFVQFLEGLDKDDAKLVIAMKDKKSPYPNITYDLVHKTFPGLLPDTAPVEVPQEFKKSAPPFLKTTEPVNKKAETGERCPFGCVSARGKALYQPGPLISHLRKVHNYTDEQIEEFKKG